MSQNLIQERVDQYRAGMPDAWVGLCFADRMALSRQIAIEDGTFLKRTQPAGPLKSDMGEVPVPSLVRGTVSGPTTNLGLWDHTIRTEDEQAQHDADKMGNQLADNKLAGQMRLGKGGKKVHRH